MTPSAVRFHAALRARYVPRQVSTVRPVSSVLRTSLRPIQIVNQVHVDARRTIVMTLATVLGSTVAGPVASFSDAIVARLAARPARHHDDEDRRSVSRAAAAHQVALVVRRAWPARTIPFTPPVPMVLVRPTSPPAIARPDSMTLDAGWGPHSTARQVPARITAAPSSDGTLDSVNVKQLTDRVVAAIDRRVLAGRERLRG